MSQNHISSFCDDVLADHDGVALAGLVARKEISATEVVAAAIARAKRVEPQLNAIQIERFAEARVEAKTTREGFFAGIPTFIKDNTAIAGMPTNHGSAAVRSSPAKATGVYAQQYMAQGFVCLGKSTLCEFGLNATTESTYREPTRNPWHRDYSCGASSGGAAALVAAGVVPIAHGNDGGGSIRIPAACCGLVGLKPTRGRHVISELAQAMPVDLIGEGVLTRTVRDTAHFHAEAEHYYRNRNLPALGLVQNAGGRKLRIGFIVDSITGFRTDASTRAAVEQAAALLAELGHTVEPIEAPMSAKFADDFVIYWSVLAFALGLAGRHIVDPSFDKSQLDDFTVGLRRLFKRRFHRLPRALYRLKRTYHEYAKLFETYDAFLTPALAHTTPKLGYLNPSVPFDELMERLTRYVSFTPFANAAGGPAIALPFCESDAGLPIAIHLFANHGDERTLLELAYALEEAHPWQRIPDIAKA